MRSVGLLMAGAAALTGTLLAAPPGGGATAGDPVAGRAVFATAGCGGCHTFSAAGSSGTVGPRLDGIGLTAAQVAAVVTAGRNVMPSFSGRLTQQQIADVAAFVAGAPVPAAGPAAPAAPARAGAVVTVVVRVGRRGVRLSPVTVEAGRIRFTMPGTGIRGTRLRVARVVAGARRPLLRRAVLDRVLRPRAASVRATLSAGTWLVFARPARARVARHALLVVTPPVAPPVAGGSSASPVPPAAPLPPPTPADMFRTFCGGCHTLAAAGTTGTVGPVLDGDPRSAGEIAAAMRAGPGVMPSFAGSLTDAQIAAIAGYVADAVRGP